LDDIHGVPAPLAEDTGTPEQVRPLPHDLSFTGCSRVRVASMYIGSSLAQPIRIQGSASANSFTSVLGGNTGLSVGRSKHSPSRAL